MPSAGPDPAPLTIDPESRARFIADLASLLEGVGLRADAPIGIALSGGPDSCALLLLAARTAARTVRAMTVDHGLRAAAAAEARAAGALCTELGAPHSIARVSVMPNGTGIQAAARSARYAALAEWAQREGLAAILTAHHADDQAETMLMRLSRGAGLSGLTGIRPARRLTTNVWLLRPLLSWRKTELEAIVTAAGIVPARDPSNHDMRYDRTAARALLAHAEWIDPSRFAASAGHLRDADAALEQWTTQLLAEAANWDGTTATFAPGDAPIDICRRALSRLLSQHFDASPDGPALMRLIERLGQGGTATLAGVKAEGGAIWRLRRAPPHRGTIRSH